VAAPGGSAAPAPAPQPSATSAFRPYIYIPDTKRKDEELFYMPKNEELFFG
jgi:hypothetical protein